MERLDKLAANAFGLTRSQAQQAIRGGRIAVDGVPCREPKAHFEAGALLTLDGQPGSYEKYVYIMMDKPAGYLSATEDSRGAAVTELLPQELRRRGLGIVGRLDVDTTGLLLLTDNGELNHRLTSPKYHMDKIYLASLDGPVGDREREIFSSGMDLGDFTAMPARLEVLPDDPCQALVTIQEGKFHQVKRMFQGVGRRVTALRRLAIGGIGLDETLGPGGWRMLTAEEREYLEGKCGIKHN